MLSPFIYKLSCLKLTFIGSRPSDHYFRSDCLSVCLSVCLFVQSFSQPSDPISIKLGQVICLGLVVSLRI